MKCARNLFITVFGITPLVIVGCSTRSANTYNKDDVVRTEATAHRSLPTEPLRVHPANPRYFSDGSGKAIYLTGSHTWTNLQDMDGPGIQYLPGESFSAYLDWLEHYNLNFIRLWIMEHAWDEKTGTTIKPLPWARTGPGEASDGKLKFDLTKFDETYFDRLRQRVLMARNRGFYVSVMLFDDWSTENPGPWIGHPFNIRNNINGINGDANNDGLGLEVHTLEEPSVTRLQAAYVRKVIDTVNDLDNVIYEIANETGISKDWQYYMIDLIKEYERSKPKRHPVGMTVGWPVLEVDNAVLSAGPADWISPNAEGGYKDNPPAADGSKVIIVDTDHLWGVGGDHTWVWKSFLRGLNPIYMDDLDSDSSRESARKAMGRTLSYANKMNLAAMIPRGDLASSGYCLANLGKEYLVYLPIDRLGMEFWLSSATFVWEPNQPLFSTFTVQSTTEWSKQTVTVNLADASGGLSVEWFNPRTGERFLGGEIAGGTLYSFEAPFVGDAVLYLVVSEIISQSD